MKNKRVLVLGLGLHGGAIGTIEWLAKNGATVTVSDTKTEEQLSSSVEKLKHVPNITYYFGNQDELDLKDIDMIVRNPAVPRKAPILQKARAAGIPVEMDSSLFFEHCTSKDIIGITGSKGKTTTSNAIAAVMQVMNPSTVAVGIDGVSPLGALLTSPSLSFVRRGDYPVVFELSSWRLEALQEKKISPHIAVCTSLYRDHLNTYSSFEEYIDVKKQIIKDQTENDIAILNADDERIRDWKKDIEGGLFWYSLQPLGENEKGIWVDGDEVYVSFITSPNPSFVRRGNDAEHPSPYEGEGTGDEVSRVQICSISDIPHRASHELRNMLPAILIGLLRGADMQTITKALQDMPPLKHRLQLVRTIDGVDYINDSAATMPDATIAALSAYNNKPLILIIGGSDKALEFEELAQAIQSHTSIKHLIWLPGTATARMQEIITPAATATSHNAATMDEAVQISSSLAQAGETVLLSPGATSFGLFLHEFDRGDSFIQSVQAL